MSDRSAMSETKVAEIRARLAVEGWDSKKIDAAVDELEAAAARLIECVYENECPECGRGLVFAELDDGGRAYGCEDETCPFECCFDASEREAWKL